MPLSPEQRARIKANKAAALERRERPRRRESRDEFIDALEAAIAARDKKIGALEAALARPRERDAAPSGPWGTDGAWIAVFGGGPRAHSMRL